VRPTVAVILAGGSGTRSGHSVPKQLVTLAGRPLLEHSVATFCAHPGIRAVVVVMVGDHLEEARPVVDRHPKVRSLVPGGTTRADSVRRGLEAAAACSVDDGDVLLHDAARPLVDAATISACLDALASAEAVTTCAPVTDTIVRTDGDVAVATVDRAELRRCQTPQGFRIATIRRAHEMAEGDPSFVPTDDCGVVLRYLPDVIVRTVDGSPRNIKVTHPIDFAVAEALLAAEPADDD
jgi:2-C-methyl-D-erythritol 4-phosphate cytidylyltransferase